MTDNITDKVLQTIEEKNVKPKSRWQFLLKSWVLWSFFGISVIIGSLSVGLLIFASRNNPLYDFLKDSGQLSAFITSLPYLWLILLALFLLIAFYNFRQTDHGYRYNGYWIVFISIVISMVGGGVVYSAGLAERLENNLYRHFEPYQRLENFRHRSLFQPEKGQLVGVIISHNDQGLQVMSPERELWTVINPDINLISPWWENLAPQQPARVIINGQVIEKNIFSADSIQPLIPIRINNERKAPPMRINK